MARGEEEEEEGGDKKQFRASDFRERNVFLLLKNLTTDVFQILEIFFRVFCFYLYYCNLSEKFMLCVFWFFKAPVKRAFSARVTTVTYGKFSRCGPRKIYRFEKFAFICARQELHRSFLPHLWGRRKYRTDPICAHSYENILVHNVLLLASGSLSSRLFLRIVGLRRSFKTKKNAFIIYISYNAF